MSIGKAMILAVLTAIGAPTAVTVLPEEMAQKNASVQQNLLTAANPPPFSFIYHTLPSSSRLPFWTRVSNISRR